MTPLAKNTTWFQLTGSPSKTIPQVIEGILEAMREWGIRKEAERDAVARMAHPLFQTNVSI